MKTMFYYTRPDEEDIYHVLGEYESDYEARRYAPDEEGVAIWEGDAREPNLFFMNGSWVRA